MTLRAGFVGLGNIGKAMALRLPRAGLETSVYDIVPGPVQELVAGGAKGAASPREVTAASDVVGVCVQTDAQVRTVLEGDDGILAAAKPGLLVIVHSTILPASMEGFAALAAKRGVELIDGCVSGSPRLPDPKFKLFVGGEAAQLARIRPYLTAIAEDRVIHTGPLGSGAKAKICVNLITYFQWAAAFESYSLARAVGLPAEVYEQVGRSNGQLTELMIQYLGTLKMPDAMRSSPDMQTYLRTNMHVAEKDLACALDLARAAGIALPGAGLISQLMARIYAVDDPKRR